MKTYTIKSQEYQTKGKNLVFYSLQELKNFFRNESKFIVSYDNKKVEVKDERKGIYYKRIVLGSRCGVTLVDEKKEEKESIKKLNYSQFFKVMQETKKEIFGVIVYKENNWKAKYSLESRSYKVSNKNKYFLSDMCGSSLFGSNLDGTDICVRLDYYNFKVDYFYILD